MLRHATGRYVDCIAFWRQGPDRQGPCRYEQGDERVGAAGPGGPETELQTGDPLVSSAGRSGRLLKARPQDGIGPSRYPERLEKGSLVRMSSAVGSPAISGGATGGHARRYRLMKSGSYLSFGLGGADDFLRLTPSNSC